MLNENFFINKFSYIVLLTPLLLITGPFLPDLVVTLSCLFFIFLIIKNKQIEFFKKFSVKIFLLFWLILISSSLMSGNIFVSLKSSFFYFRFAMFVLILIYLNEKNTHFQKRFLKVGVGSIIIVILSCLLEFLFLRYEYFSQLYELYITRNDIGFEVGSNALVNQINNRVSGIFGSEGVAGSFLLRLSPFFFIYYIYSFYKSEKKPSKKKIFLFNLFFLLLTSVVLFSGERAAFILLCFSIFLNFLIIKRIRQYLKYGVYFSLILIILMLNFDPMVKGRIISQTKYQLTHFHDLSKKKQDNEDFKSENIFLISEIHQGHFYAAWKIFLDNKYLGAGLKGYRHQCYNKKDYIKDLNISCSTHPHNTFMQFLSETGIMGTLFYLIFLLFIIFKIIKKIYLINFKKINTTIKSDIKNCILVCILITLWPLTTSGSFFNNWLSILYFLPIAFYFNESRFFNND